MAGRTDAEAFHRRVSVPNPARATARAVWQLAAKDRPGLYHLAGRRLSRWEIGQLMAARWPGESSHRAMFVVRLFRRAALARLRL